MELMGVFQEVLEAFMAVTSTGAFVEFSVEACKEDIEDIKASTKETSMEAYTTASMEVTFTKASIEDFMEVMEPFVEVMEAFIEVTSMEVFMEASMDNMESMKASTEVTFTGASTKSFIEVTSHEISYGSFPWKK